LIAVSIGLSVRRSKPNQIMLWPSNRNKGDDPDGNNSDLKFNSLIHHADHSELFFHSSFFRNCQKSKIEILSYRKGGFRQEWIKVGWKAYGSYVKLIKIDPFNYVFGCVQVKYYLRVDHLDTNFVYHIKFTQNCNCDKKTHHWPNKDRYHCTTRYSTTRYRNSNTEDIAQVERWDCVVQFYLFYS